MIRNSNKTTIKPKEFVSSKPVFSNKTTCWTCADLLWQRKQKIAAHATSVTPGPLVAGTLSQMQQKQTNNDQEVIKDKQQLHF